MPPLSSTKHPTDSGVYFHTSGLFLLLFLRVCSSVINGGLVTFSPSPQAVFSQHFSLRNVARIMGQESITNQCEPWQRTGTTVRNRFWCRTESSKSSNRCDCTPLLRRLPTEESPPLANPSDRLACGQCVGNWHRIEARVVGAQKTTFFTPNKPSAM